ESLGANSIPRKEEGSRVELQPEYQKVDKEKMQVHVKEQAVGNMQMTEKKNEEQKPDPKDKERTKEEVQELKAEQRKKVVPLTEVKKVRVTETKKETEKPQLAYNAMKGETLQPVKKEEEGGKALVTGRLPPQNTPVLSNSPRTLVALSRDDHQGNKGTQSINKPNKKEEVQELKIEEKRTALTTEKLAPQSPHAQ
ncbi:hypothetical protein MMC06_005554, partial [Schaereria dolodes]|nr:hypothetical protein [Schaereria dolodes]